MVSFDTMVQKIYARSVMKMGQEPQHSLMVTIPRKICRELNIEKGIKLYFKMYHDRFIVSKETRFLEDTWLGEDSIKSADTTNEKTDYKNGASHGILEALENW
ncbi:MAG: AbrB/MazE/SpoVT family DNA-binding domain-containing protein [Nitrososphaera sp.]